MHTVIIANGLLDAHPRLSQLWRDADSRIAADGGAVNARKVFGIPPHVLIGDLDSLDQETRLWCEQARVRMLQHPRAKDQTDLELAIDHAMSKGATEITVLGVLGGRLDQAMANILLLVKPAAAHVHARIAAPGLDAQVAWSNVSIDGRVGETVSLIPLTEKVDGIVTRGLVYPLRNETLSFGATRGVSNQMSLDRSEVSFAHGLLLVVHLWDPDTA